MSTASHAGHYYNRAWVISGGCLIWGVVTVGFSMARTLREGIFFWAFNGLGLALARARAAAPRNSALPVPHRHSSCAAVFRKPEAQTRLPCAAALKSRLWGAP